MKISALLMALLCAFSCQKHETELDITTFVVSGTVYDSETGEPVPEVTVSLLGFGSDDPKMTKAISTNTRITGSDGTYRILILNPKARKYYKILATDNSQHRQENYSGSVKFLYISDGSTAYNERTKSYELNAVDFYLEKE